MDRSMSEWMRSRRKYKFPKKRGARGIWLPLQSLIAKGNTRGLILSVGLLGFLKKKKNEVTDEGGQVQVAAGARPNY